MYYVIMYESIHCTLYCTVCRQCANTTCLLSEGEYNYTVNMKWTCRARHDVHKNRRPSRPSRPSSERWDQKAMPDTRQRGNNNEITDNWGNIRHKSARRARLGRFCLRRLRLRWPWSAPGPAMLLLDRCGMACDMRDHHVRRCNQAALQLPVTMHVKVM